MGGDARHTTLFATNKAGARHPSRVLSSTRGIGLHRGVPESNLNLRAYGVHRGVPSLTFFQRECSGSHPHSEKRQGGQPSRQCVSVQLFQRRSRPPAHHWRGRGSSIILRATTPMVRRWDAEGGPEGRGSGKPRRRPTSPTSRRLPLSLGYPIQTAAKLTVGSTPPYGRRTPDPTTSRPHDLTLPCDPVSI